MFVVHLHHAVGSEFLKLIIHTGYPHDSYSYSAPFKREGLAKFRASYTNVTILRAESPYNTHCRNSAKVPKKSACLSSCLNAQMLQAFDRISFSVITTSQDSIHKKHVSYEMLKNKSTLALVDAIEVDCGKKCRRHDCHSQFSITNFGKERGDPHILRIDVNIPNQPSITIRYKPKFLFSEFIIFMCSCVGIWCGVAAIDLNPAKLLSRVRDIEVVAPCSFRRAMFIRTAAHGRQIAVLRNRLQALQERANTAIG